MDTSTTVAYALFNLQKRGKLFLGPGVPIYRGQIVGAHCRDNDLTVNPAKGKKLTNIRAAGRDENVILTPPVLMGLEASIAYINDDELVEVTPTNIRLRKDPRVWGRERTCAFPSRAARSSTPTAIATCRAARCSPVRARIPRKA